MNNVKRIVLGVICVATCLLAGPATSPGVADELIQPGARMVAPAGCTLNFVFRGAGPEAARYIGTAGHCVSAVGQRVAMEGGDIGTVAFYVFKGWDDFALIKLDEKVLWRVSPEVRRIGGPTGFTTADSTFPGDPVSLYGHGMVYGDRESTRFRPGVLTAADEREWNAALPAIYGDSGGPVLHGPSGAALGVISGFVVPDTTPHTVKGPTIERVLKLLATAGLPVELLTA